jgi:hypothetical protein
MAQLITEKITIEISRLARDGEKLDPIVTSDLGKTLEEVIQELVPSGSVVEAKAE